MNPLKNIKVKALIGLVSGALLFNPYLTEAYAYANDGFNSSIVSSLIYDSSRIVAPGVEERRITYKSKEGFRVENFVLEVDLRNNPGTSVITGSYKGEGLYGRSSVRTQAAQAASEGKPVVAAVNGDFYTIATGEPVGCLIRDGVEVKALSGIWKFFGIRKDGTAVIGGLEDYEENKDQLTEAIGGSQILVENGKVLNHSASDSTYYSVKNPRTAVGIKEDGAVIFVVTDGRQDLYSAGITLGDLALVMKELGCKTALNLDGGGSSTFLVRDQGTGEISLRNRPSDKYERAVANSLLVLWEASRETNQGTMGKVLEKGSAEKFSAGMDISKSLGNIMLKTMVSGNVRNK